MKKFVVLSLLFLSLNGLYAMEMGESVGTIPSIEIIPEGALPQELLYEIARHKLLDSMPIAPEDAVQDIAEYAHGNMVNSVAVFPDGRSVLSGGHNGKVKTADANTGNLIVEYDAYDNMVGSVAVFPDGQRVLSCGAEVTGGLGWKVKIADARTGKLLAEYAHDRLWVSSVAVFPDGRWVLSGGYDGKVKIADARTGKLLAEYEHANKSAWVWAVGVFPDGKRVLSGGDDKKVTIKSLRPLLLATHQLKDPTLFQFLLFKRLQEKLLQKKDPLLIGQSDRNTLEGMPDLKKLLKVEKSKSKTTNPIWRLQLRRGADDAEPEPAAGWPNICSVV